VLLLQPVEPGDLLRSMQRGSGRLGERQKAPGMGVLGGPRLAALGEALQGILADRLQHGEAQLAACARAALDQLLVEKRVQRVQQRGGERAHRVAQRLRGLEGPASGEDSQPAKEQLLAEVEQAIAPLDGGAQRALALGQVAWAAREDRQPVVEPGQQHARGKQRRARRRQLDGER